MKSSEENIEFLIIQKLAGTASNEELQQLEQLVSTDPHAAALWEAALRQNTSEDVETHFDRIDKWQWKEVEQLQLEGKRIKRKRVAMALSTIAAAAAVVIFIIYIIAPRSGNSSSQPIALTTTSQSLFADSNKQIALKLASGHVIDLSRQLGSIHYREATLDNNNSSLSFTAGSGGTDNTDMNSLVVPAGKDYHIVLSDGTQVWMNSATTLEFPFVFVGKTREIRINGEAFLKVAKDASRPFLVHTATGFIKVLGTSFNLNCYQSNRLAVSLVEGSVQLVSGNKETALKPGFEAVSQQGHVTIKPFDEDVVLAWRNGRYYFDNASFDEIMQVLPRWYGLEVAFDNKAISQQHFTGMVNRNKTVTVFLDKLKVVMQFDYYFDTSGKLHIR
jgi:ferric-dicitrate binding protein FerR (iron transport regulator)